MKKYAALTVLAGLCVWGPNVHAQEIKLGNSDTSEMSLSIYNQNLAQVRDVRQADLKSGVSTVAFEGVAQQMKPETLLLDANGITVLEKNYEYDLLTYNNILTESIGQEVKTVMTNPQTGANIFNKAVVVNSNYGSPLLKFDYGIEGTFPGRVVFDKLPENLRVKPTLVAKVLAENEGGKELGLTYLTGGLSWQADYVAEVAGNGSLDWQGWVSLNNQSGADYKDASVQLVSGSVNTVENPPAPQPRMMLAAKAAPLDAVNESAASGGMAAQNLGEYYVYRLPFKTDVLDQQTKQVSLMEKKGVKYETSYKLQSPLYLSAYGQGGEFKKAHPDLVYQIINSRESGLGLPMPQGTVRFYEKGADGKMQFTGAAEFPQLAEGAKAELAVGKSFDLYAEGQVVNQQKIAEKTSELEVSVTFHNAKKEAVNVIFEQAYSGNAVVVSESLKSSEEQAKVLKWNVEIPASGKTVLTYKLRLSRN